MTDQTWSWVLTIIGLAGFYLAGKKIWWAWYVNIANQVLWFVFAVTTELWGFLLGTFAYLFVFIKNAYIWTKEHYASQGSEAREDWSLPVGEISVEVREEGLVASGKLFDTPEGSRVKELLLDNDAQSRRYFANGLESEYDLYPHKYSD